MLLIIFMGPANDEADDAAYRIPLFPSESPKTKSCASFHHLKTQFKLKLKNRQNTYIELRKNLVCRHTKS